MTLEYILVSLALSLFLTLLLELLFSLAFNIKGRSLLMVVFANILTNPVVVVLYLLLCRHFLLPDFIVVPILEAGAVFIEALIYSKYTSIKKPFHFSVSVNIFSYFSGALLSALL